MEYLTWNPTWETGVAEIDRQHKVLLERIDGLFQAVHGQGDADVGEMLLFLATYVDTHFKDEEALMERSGYPALGKHRAIHAALRSRVQQLIKEHRANPNQVTEVVVDFLAEWLLGHIDQHDRALAQYLLAGQPRPVHP